MKSILFPLMLAVGLCGCATATKQTAETRAPDTRLYELRTYFAAPGKLDEVHARSRDHAMKFFKKHGIETIGYWTPVNNTNDTLMLLLAYPSREKREESWKAFMADPEWTAILEKTEANGKIVSRVDQMYLQQTDFSPAIKKGNVSHDGVFELRTYTTPSGLLPNLDSRFRDHTMALFKKHGMKNWAYFHKTTDQPEADTTLLYFLTHTSPEAAKASFDTFRQDPAWVAAKDQSEKNGSLTVTDGVKSHFLKATDYSPTK
ncbi:MAG: NIPSNAP family protein [Verrucomicrobiota bacterium]